MAYYIFLEDGRLNGAGEARQLTEGVENLEVTEEVYNLYNEAPNKYIYSDGEIVENPDFEAEEAQKERERIGKLSMTKFDLYKYVLAPSGISYEQLREVLNGDPNLRVAWDLCARVYRGDTDFIQGVKDFIPTMTDEILDNIFEMYGE